MYNTDLPTRAELPSSKQLVRSTAIAAAVAAGLLVTVVLPSEYGVDPTGVGRALGLTEMGEIKAQLAAEAEADRQAGEGASAAPSPDRRSGLSGLGAFAARVLSIQAAAQTLPVQARAPEETTLTLQPNQGLEVKLRMQEGARATYSWTSTGPVNYDMHGEPPNPGRNSTHSYKAARSVTSDSGELRAAFAGTHGWFFRNRSNQNVTVTLRTSGDYQGVIRP
ncbi:MAG: transmembrane anchor protein [Azospirillum brasilense]|jgi:hypothetical protein|nr:MAG: transmembrane anchor protein [Azospirillum brasilense]